MSEGELAIVQNTLIEYYSGERKNPPFKILPYGSKVEVQILCKRFLIFSELERSIVDPLTSKGYVKLVGGGPVVPTLITSS